MAEIPVFNSGVFRVRRCTRRRSRSWSREEIEGSRIEIMKALVQAQEPSAKDVDDLMICRFLRARDLDVEKASEMFLNYLRWRKEFVPNGFILPSEIPNELAHKKLFMQGYDKARRLMVVVFAGQHKPTTAEEFNCFAAFALDKICARMPSRQEKFTAIANLEGWGYANSDIRGYLAALPILQDCYPERLGLSSMCLTYSQLLGTWFTPSLTVTQRKRFYLLRTISCNLTRLSFPTRWEDHFSWFPFRSADKDPTLLFPQ